MTRAKTLHFLQNYAVLILIALLVAALTLLSDSFLTGRNLLNILNQNAPLAIMASAMTLVIIVGGFDLSVGAIFAMGSVTSAWLAVNVNPFLGLALAPFVEWIATRPRLGAALKGISAAVVGVIGTLAVWFAMHVFFGATATLVFGPLSVTLPDLGSAKLLPIGIALTAGWLLLVLHWNLVAALALSALAGLAASAIG